jgi:ubiquinone/menaquinone biosynthesis C-methylase UbiE
MSLTSDARFWDRTSRSYAKSAIADEAAYERTLTRTASFLKRDDAVLELGCGTGTTALRLAGGVQHYLATDLSTSMIAIAQEKYRANPVRGLTFRAATAQTLAAEAERFNAVLGFSYLHLVRDLPDTLRCIRDLLVDDGLFVTKTPCVGEMNFLIRLALPPMRAIGKAPYAGVFRAPDLRRHIELAGFDILVDENHATKGNDKRPYIVARKR